jgi:uncharacterized protein (TIGR00251 family)
LPDGSAANWFDKRGDGVAIRVRLTPKGGSDRIDGVTVLADESRVIAARVRAAPEKGAANKALEKLLANALGVARATVSVASGHKARLKTVHVSGDARELSGALAALEAKGNSR